MELSGSDPSGYGGLDLAAIMVPWHIIVWSELLQYISKWILRCVFSEKIPIRNMCLSMHVNVNFRSFLKKMQIQMETGRNRLMNELM